MVVDTTNSQTMEAPNKAQLPKQGRRNWRERFLKTMRQTGSVQVACREAKIHHSTAYRLARRNQRFSKMWAKAEEIGKSVRLSEADDILFRVGIKGIKEPVFQNGEEVGRIKRRQAEYAKLWYRRHCPEIFQSGRNHHEGDTINNVSINVLGNHDLYRALMNVAGQGKLIEAHTTGRLSTESNVSPDATRGTPPPEHRPHPPLSQPHEVLNANSPPDPEGNPSDEKVVEIRGDGTGPSDA